MSLINLKTKGMCEKAVENEPDTLKFVPDHFKAKGMCDQAVKEDPYSLQFVPDWFVTREGVDMWHDDYYNDDGDYWDNNDDDEDEFFEWYGGYKKRKAQKAKIKEELLPIVWHPDRVMDWCMSGDKRWWK